MSTIAVVGRFNAGKSTFLNSILKTKDLLPVEMIVCTNRVAFVSYGERERLVIVFKDNSIKELPISGFSQIQESENPDIKYFHVFKNDKDLLKKEHLVFIDTPGSDARVEDDLNIDFGLDFADAVILVLSDRELGKADKALIYNAINKYKIENICIVFTKIDNLGNNHNPEEPDKQAIEELRGSIQKEINSFNHTEEIKLNFFSSINYLRNKPDIWTKQSLREIDRWIGGVGKAAIKFNNSDERIIAYFKDVKYLHSKLNHLLPGVEKHVHDSSDWAKSIYKNEKPLYGISYPYFEGAVFLFSFIKRNKSGFNLKVGILYSEKNYSYSTDLLNKQFIDLGYESRLFQGYFEGSTEKALDIYNLKLMELFVKEEFEKIINQ